MTTTWRFDRMSTVCDPGSGRITASFAGVAKHYSVAVAVCPPRRGNRKGVVEKDNHTAAQRWWRTVADDVTVEQAQADLDRFCRARGDTRMRATPDGRCAVAALAATEPLQPVPGAPYPVIVTQERTASRQALVTYRGNRYSVPPELAVAKVMVTRPVGGAFIDIATTSGIVIARHKLLADGLGGTVRDSGHVIAWMPRRWPPRAAAVLIVARNGSHPGRSPVPPPPNSASASPPTRTLTVESNTAATDSTVIDLSAYERAAQRRSTLQ